MRTFIAIPVPSTPGIRKLISLLEVLRGPLKTIPSTQLHLTLKFLGETKFEDIPALAQSMTECFQKWPLNSMHLLGAGAFPRLERPNVLWAGVQETPELMSLADCLEFSCDALGYPVEPRPYHPHITLARVKARPPAKLFSILHDFASTDLGTVEVEKICLYQSELNSTGPVYTVLASASSG